MEEEKELLAKYPRTFHLPCSNCFSDDKYMTEVGTLLHSERVVATVKMDGENTTLYRDNYHARSMDRARHPSRDWCGSFWASIAYKIPPGIRICGENLYATHSIHYTDLPSYFLGFSAWTKDHMCLSWDDTLALFTELGITPVSVLFDGPGKELPLTKLIGETISAEQEGFVVRDANSFHMSEFGIRCGKYVRPNHVQTDEHWLSKPVVPNMLRKQ